MFYQFMVDFNLPEEVSEALLSLVSCQQPIAHQYLQEGKLVNYALSLDKPRLWAVFNAVSEMEVMEMLQDFPLARHTRVEVFLLNQFQFPAVSPDFSLN